MNRGDLVLAASILAAGMLVTAVVVTRTPGIADTTAKIKVLRRAAKEACPSYLAFTGPYDGHDPIWRTQTACKEAAWAYEEGIWPLAAARIKRAMPGGDPLDTARYKVLRRAAKEACSSSLSLEACHEAAWAYRY